MNTLLLIGYVAWIGLVVKPLLVGIELVLIGLVWTYTWLYIEQHMLKNNYLNTLTRVSN